MTQSLEDYLETVLFLSEKGAVRVTDIASRLEVSKPSVLTALKILEEQGFLEHSRYRPVVLTQKGKQKADKIRSRHRFITDFLVKIVGVNSRIAEQDACKMEHVLSPETLKKMQKLMAGKD